MCESKGREDKERIVLLFGEDFDIVWRGLEGINNEWNGMDGWMDGWMDW